MAEKTVGELLLELTPKAWVTTAITVLLVVSFGLSWALAGVSPFSPTGAQLLDAGAVFGPSLVAGEWWRLLTSALLSGSAIFLALALYVFWNDGQVAERIFGHATFFFICASSAIAGSLASVAAKPLTVLVGTAAPVFGIQGAMLAFTFAHRDVLPQEGVAGIRRSLLMALGINFAFLVAMPGMSLVGPLASWVTGAIAGASMSRNPADPSTGLAKRTINGLGLCLFLLAGAIAVEHRLQSVPEIKASQFADQGLEAVKAKRWAEGIEKYTAALELIPSEVNWLHNRAIAFNEQRDFKRAFNDRKQIFAFESTPQHLEQQCLAAVKAFSGSDLSQLELMCSDASQPLTSETLATRSHGRRALGKFELALQDANEAVKLEPNNPSALFARAFAHSSLEQVTEAIADYDELSRVAGERAVVWNNKAWMQVLSGDFDNALKSVDRALQLSPDDPGTKGTRCFALVGLKRLEDARADCARAVSADADDLMDSGMMAFLEGRTADAQELWRQAVAKDPSEHLAVDRYMKTTVHE